MLLWLLSHAVAVLLLLLPFNQKWAMNKKANREIENRTQMLISELNFRQSNEKKKEFLLPLAIDQPNFQRYADGRNQ